MRDPFSRLVSSFQSSQDSWLQRIRENFHQLLTPARAFPSSANGAPIHLLHQRGSVSSGRAQSASLVTHAAVLGALLLLAFPARRGDPPNPPHGVNVSGRLPIGRKLLESLMGHAPSEGAGSGGGHTQIPTTSGDLLPSSSIQIVRPSLPPKRESVLEAPPTILDPAAPPVLNSVNKIGLPWMRDETNSPGPGDSNTIGSSDGNTMGDGPIDGPGGTGVSSTGYRPGMSQPVCVYCPDPQYTDEARKAKVQGTVTLKVLVGADGRAAQVRFVSGIGLGLDERALETVRGWKFTPAKDAAHHPVPTWITIEVVFRLI